MYRSKRRKIITGGMITTNEHPASNSHLIVVSVNREYGVMVIVCRAPILPRQDWPPLIGPPVMVVHADS
jgi:hypothetical protein